MDQIFKMIDSDGSGGIDESELMRFFNMVGDGGDKEFVRELIREVDGDSDGVISYEEFKTMMTRLVNKV